MYKEKGILKDDFIISDLYEYTTEKSFISKLNDELKKKLNKKNLDRKDEFEIIKCYKCGKNMEVSKQLIQDDPHKYVYRPKEIKFACRQCINSFYSSALDIISYGVYDNKGNPVNKRSPRLI